MLTGDQICNSALNSILHISTTLLCAMAGLAGELQPASEGTCSCGPPVVSHMQRSALQQTAQHLAHAQHSGGCQMQQLEC
jgi:hypothetical protein